MIWTISAAKTAQAAPLLAAGGNERQGRGLNAACPEEFGCTLPGFRGAIIIRSGRVHDPAHNRKGIFNAGLIPNIPENPRNRKHPKRGRKRLFNAAIHALRLRVERTFAWEDKFKRLLLRFERIQQRHYGMQLLAYTLINLRAFCGV